MTLDTLKWKKTDFYKGLKWLITLRAIFGIVLLSSGFISRITQAPSISMMAFGLVFFISLLILLFSLVYALVLPRIKKGNVFAYFQIVIDSLLITLIIFATGGPDSFFHFLYLLVIMYSSLLLGRKAAVFVAGLSSLEYSVLTVVEAFGIIGFLGPEFNYYKSFAGVLYKILSTVSACFLMSFLGSLLADQAKKAKKELEAMGLHLKRVEKLAFAGEMAAGLAHEIKNPLAALSGSVQILKDEISECSDNYRLIQIILRETDRLNNLVTNFLSLSSQKSGDVKLVNVGDIIEDVIGCFRKDDKTRDIEFKINSFPECRIMIDPNQLSQVIWNLVQNAADAIVTEDSDGRIEVSCSQTADKRVMLMVKDNGSGMSSEDLTSVFTPFYTTKPAGNGLGLCIVHRILENYDARIDITSREDSGTEFRIFFKK
ncbi:two-component system sensor histidine kinase NtrB [Desulforegula conservatrix]|uniref:two-component system sensor histidine kinase NtrB n=1 Tax=Desulforegula conservatrix TaxID=153026 RepID=UPI0003FCFE8A|nr:ATP-binding protein [Desulforegula conservatrix]